MILKKRDNMKVLVTGGVGFIGSHLVERLIEKGQQVIVLDNMSSGSVKNLEKCKDNKMLEIRKIDLLKNDISSYLHDVEKVWHLAANADVRLGEKDTITHLKQNVIVTYKILEAMRKSNVRKIIFTSSSTVYGEAHIRPTPESFGPLKPISLYGASKLAAESLISSYCYSFGMKAWIYRLANVIGSRSNRGVIYDLIEKLKKNPNRLEILGNGEQKKSYIYISECIDAFFTGLKGNDILNIYNVGSEDSIKVKKIAKYVCNAMKVKPIFIFTGGKTGWRGDIPKMQLDIKKMKSMGWVPKMNSEEAVKKTVKEMFDTYAK